jgi:5-carboxymethyl-2-hydroxymuconate isomerase
MRLDSRRRSAEYSLSEFVEKTFQVGEGVVSMKFKTSIGRSTVIPQTQKVGKTLFETHSTHKITRQYRALAVEIAARLARLENLVLLPVVIYG